jgi:hypothetical protein
MSILQEIDNIQGKIQSTDIETDNNVIATRAAAIETSLAAYQQSIEKE